MSSSTGSSSSGSSSTGLRFGFADGITNLDYAAVEASARDTEELGAEFLAYGESLDAGGDPYAALATAGRVTDRIRLGTAVVTPGTRHPALLARTLLTLDAMTGGRMFVGVGTGMFLGPGRSRLQTLEDYCLTVKSLMAGEEVSVNGHTHQLRAAGEGTPVPLWIAAEGPIGLQLAGRIADGVLIENGAQPSVVEHVRRYVTKGAESVGRSPDEIDLWFMTRIRIDESEDAAIHNPVIEGYGAGFAAEAWKVVREGDGSPVEQLLAKKGLVVTEDEAERIAAFNQEASSEFWSPENVVLMDKYGLRDWIARTYFVLGTKEEVVARMQVLADAGASDFMCPRFVPAATSDVRDVIDALRPPS